MTKTVERKSCKSLRKMPGFFRTLAPRMKLWLSTDRHDGVFGDGKCRLLKAIELTGSLSAAAAALRISYRKAWGDIKKTEKSFGFDIVTRERGGLGGGKTTLTSEGQRLVRLYSVFRDETEKKMQAAFKKYLKVKEMRSHETR